MRAKKTGAAALIALAALSLSFGLARAQKTPLVIEVIASDALTAAAAAQETHKPTVLIYHTHTWEAYEMTQESRYSPTETWRTADERYNMVRVGRELKQALEAQGFSVVHDTTAFEPPTLSSAYTRSLEMLERRLHAGEHYDYIFDVHRDAYSGLYNGANCAVRDGENLAYVMLLVGKGTGATGSGFDERPDWPANLALAQAITDAMNESVPGVSRDVKIKSGRFNQHVSSGALLIEVGNNYNTLDEALAVCDVIAGAVAAVHAQRKLD